MKIGNIDHVAISVTDLDASIEWYQTVLGLERRYTDAWEGTPIMLCAQDTCLALFETQGEEPASAPDDRPVHRRDHRSSALIWHIAFKLDRDAFNEAGNQLKDLGITFRFSDHGICHSIYIHDPDGHQIELVTYEICVSPEVI